tara:strand:- start:89 stop:967 length:879 start_codon:yes stop_codon:yes gene_type:complete
MASLYKNKGIWYVSVSFDNQRMARSLKTRNKVIAYKFKDLVSTELIKEHLGIKKKKKEHTFTQLAEIFINGNPHWSPNTRAMYEIILRDHINGKPLPKNPTSRAIYTRHINCCWNWGLKNGLIEKANKLTGDTIGEARNRVFTSNELNMLKKGIKCPKFNSFVRLAYYTGARSSEIRSLRRENIKNDYTIVDGKTGPRIVKFNRQAQRLINEQKELWDYSKDFVSHKFKKECRKLGIKNARFHDLRRTFGYNLVRQGMSIYKVSKLLGHASVRTTEKHYAPLLTTDIEDFCL